MKKIFIVLVMLLCVISTLGIHASANNEQTPTEESVQNQNQLLNNANVTEGNLATNVHWKYTESNKTLSITGNGTIVSEFKPGAGRPWDHIATEIEEVYMDKTVKTKSMALWFSGCTSLERIYFQIPDGVETVHGLFFECASLEELPDNFVIPDSVIDMSIMFGGCSRLQSVNNLRITNHVEEISAIFSECRSLSRLPDGFIIPDSVIEMPGVFYGCESLSQLPDGFTIPKNVQDARSAFQDCTSLQTFPESMSLPQNADLDDIFLITNGNPVETYLPNDISDSMKNYNWNLANRKLVSSVNLMRGQELEYSYLTDKGAGKTVTVVNGDETTVYDVDNYTVDIQLPLEPREKGKVIKEWTKTHDGDDNHTLTAVIVDRVYQIQFLDESGNVLQTQSKKYLDQLDFVSMEKKGYQHIGWKEKNTDILWTFDKNTVESDLILEPVFQVIPYTITYHLDEGIQNQKNPESYTIEDTIQLYKPQREGFEFVGWYQESDYKTEIKEITKGTIGDIELYAKWQALSKDISTPVSSNHDDSIDKVVETQDSSGYESYIFMLVGSMMILGFTYRYQRKER